MTTQKLRPHSWRAPARLFSRPGRLTALLLSACATAFAQSTPANRTTTSSDTTTITLSPFEVRDDSDVGYTATSALSGGRTDTPLKLTAASISVMTSQFLSDIAATDLQTAMEWANNFVPQLDLNHQAGSGHTINLRNMGSSFQSRNHFMWYVPSDSYNTERYEFSRGPNGVLFGDAGAGGISTNLTKRARFDAVKTSASLWGTSYGGYRSTRITTGRSPEISRFVSTRCMKTCPRGVRIPTICAGARTSPAPTASRRRIYSASNSRRAVTTAPCTQTTLPTRAPIGMAARPMTA